MVWRRASGTRLVFKSRVSDPNVLVSWWVPALGWFCEHWLGRSDSFSVHMDAPRGYSPQLIAHEFAWIIVASAAG